jgi:hypothetical protein
VVIEETEVTGTVVVTVVVKAVEIQIEAGVPVGKEVNALVEVETHKDLPLTEMIGGGQDRGAIRSRPRIIHEDCEQNAPQKEDEINGERRRSQTSESGLIAEGHGKTARVVGDEVKHH